MKTTIQETQMATRSPAEQAVRFSFATPIKTIQEAAAFIKALADTNLMFHFEDQPAEIKYLFSAAEAVLLRRRVAELYSFDWSVYHTECPIGYYLNHCVEHCLSHATS